MNTPPPFDESLLASYLLGECSESQAAEIRSAAERSPRLSATIEDLRRAISGLDDLRTLSPAMQVTRAQRERLRELFQKRENLVDRAVSAVREIIAVLTFDSWLQPKPLAGFRGATTARVTRFVADSIGVDLQIAPSARADSWHLVGQLTGVQNAASVRATSDDPARTLDSMTSPDGYFDVQLPAGAYTFRFDTGTNVIVVGPLLIGHKRPDDFSQRD